MADLEGRIRDRLGETFERPSPQDEAVSAVLDLRPPTVVGGGDPALGARYLNGWRDCRRAVVAAIAEELEVSGA